MTGPLSAPDRTWRGCRRRPILHDGAAVGARPGAGFPRADERCVVEAVGSRSLAVGEGVVDSLPRPGERLNGLYALAAIKAGAEVTRVHWRHDARVTACT